MEFEEHEEQEEDMEIPTPPPPGYETVTNSSSRPKTVGPTNTTTIEGAPRKASGVVIGGTVTGTIRYRECQKNHAVSLGGHAVDGCGEFMAAGEEGTIDALKCAACSCHRNFHRKEINDGSSSEQAQASLLYHHHHNYHPHQQQQQFAPYYRSAVTPQNQGGYLHITTSSQQRQPLALPATSAGGHSRDLEDISNPSSSGGGGGGTSTGLKKRHRTKFSQEQKEKMLAFAESLGWRIQKHDEAAVEQFCTDTGVRRQVLKVWMHNNKHTLGKKP
ncbi:zinc-finger homeodomain protein 2-like [Fagus crenata]